MVHTDLVSGRHLLGSFLFSAPGALAVAPVEGVDPASGPGSAFPGSPKGSLNTGLEKGWTGVRG